MTPSCKFEKERRKFFWALCLKCATGIPHQYKIERAKSEQSALNCTSLRAESTLGHQKHFLSKPKFFSKTPRIINRMTSELPSLTGRVCLVTGASRGIGKGIALMLAKAGATVYITGRKLESLNSVVEEVGSGAGKCIPVQCDHANDKDVQEIFYQIKVEQNGRLDVLVNNAYKGVQSIIDNSGKKFYEQPLEMWDEINTVGLRSNYVAAYHAANMMVPNKQGLIVNISSFGGLSYLFNIPYGVGKAANDRMMADMSIELRKSNIAAISLWPGAVNTETIKATLQSDKPQAEQMARLFQNAEDVTYTGKAVAWLAADPNIMKKSGSVLIVAELAREYGFKDVGGVQRLSFRQLKSLTTHAFPSIAWLVPEFLYVPCWLIGAVTHRFGPPVKAFPSET